jgi:hypothetical protein
MSWLSGAAFNQYHEYHEALCRIGVKVFLLAEQV